MHKHARTRERTYKLRYTWQPLITGDQHNQESTEAREIIIIIENRKYCYTIREGQISRGWSCQPKMKVDSLRGSKSSKQKHTIIFKGSLVLLGTFPRPKTKGKGRRTRPNRRLPPTSQRGPPEGDLPKGSEEAVV